MKNEKSKASALIALGLAGMTLAYIAGILAHHGSKQERDTLLACVIFGIGFGCLLVVWGAARWGRADEAQRQELEQRKSRKGVAA